MDYTRLRPLLFRLDPENAHQYTLFGLNIAHRTGLARLFFPKQKKTVPKTVMGIQFKNPIGLAAGFDKNGDCIDGLFDLGFGFVEVGTVTPRPQSGNPRPRLFRIPEAHALINRMGFNNYGVDYLVHRLKEKSFAGPVGINIGKNAHTPIELAHNDYIECLKKVYPYADYVAINISSPNTPGLRSLQETDNLTNLLSLLKKTQGMLSETCHKYVPLAVKLSPDLADITIDEIGDILKHFKIDGVIATNTSTGREGVAHMPFGVEKGGLSGNPVKKKALHVLKCLVPKLGREIPLIGAGGIMSAESAKERIENGAELVQLYTGLIYQGPKLIHEIIDTLSCSYS
jgi:dihydroorotate dehydrogenase